MTTAPARTSDADVFADDVLADPWPTWQALRAAGPVVHLDRYDTWVLPRHAEVRAALGDHERFSSARGVGYEPQVNAQLRGTVLASDPPEHDRLRAVLADRLAPRALASLRTTIAEQADALVAAVARSGPVDVVAELAAVFPVTVVADLLGLPEDSRDQLPVVADAAFNNFGPFNRRVEETAPAAQAMGRYLSTEMARERLRPDGWAAAVYDAADRGEIGHDSVQPLLSAYLVASMDTTINAIASTVWLWSRAPEVYARLRAEPDLVRAAFEESLRLESPVQCFFRHTTTDVDIDGTVIPQGARVMLAFGG
ncbi:cytochrome P450 [Pseudonocardia sp. DLS-67]